MITPRTGHTVLQLSRQSWLVPHRQLHGRLHHLHNGRTAPCRPRRRICMQALLTSPVELAAVSVAVWCSWTCMQYIFGRRGKLPYLQWQHNDFNLAVMSRCPTIRSKYHVLPPLANGHVETIFAALTRVAPMVKYARTQLCISDGGTVALDYEDTKADLPFDADRVCCPASLSFLFIA